MYIHDTSVTFIGQRVAVECHLIDLCGKVSGDGIHLLRQFRIIQNLAASVDQPCRLDVVAVGMQIQNGIIMLIEKYFLSVELRIINFLSEHIHDPQKASAHFFIPGYPVQLRISFKNMKQGIHGLVCQNTVLRQFLIGFRFKVSGECFQISHLIHTRSLNQSKQLFRQLQGFCIPAGLIVRGQRIDAECLIVGMFCGILRGSVIV